MRISQVIVLFINVIGIAFGIYCLFLDYKSLGLITIGAHILWAAIVLTQNDNYESVSDKKADKNDNEEETYGEKVEEYLNVTLKNDGKGMYKGSLIIYDNHIVFETVDSRRFVMEGSDIETARKEGRFKASVNNDVFIFSNANDCDSFMGYVN